LQLSQCRRRKEPHFAVFHAISWAIYKEIVLHDDENVSVFNVANGVTQLVNAGRETAEGCL